MPPAKKRIYAQDLHIDLSTHEESEYFKWFLACLLFGKPVQQEVARRAFVELVEHEHIASPSAILNAGWDRLVEILDRAHYVRYDFSTADKLLDVSGALREDYEGRLGVLLDQCKTVDEVARRLQEFKGVGPKTAEIFLRDMEPVLDFKSQEEEEEEEEEEEG
ncbi:hypothetical protein VTO42DRAFT_4113 [Malbranchea cinnamomea]